MKPPYMMAFFKGSADLEYRPRTHGIREFLRPLRGAKITGFFGSLEEGYYLEYEVNGMKSLIDYQITEAAGADFVFTDTDESIREESYSRRAGGGDRPPRLDGERRSPRPGDDRGKGKGKGGHLNCSTNSS
ncbi:hypothetical protein N9B21_01160 [Verrucomicrobiales bacterium]|nr:hypothetical protein [Verrucomicrobiales bacterium]